MAIESGLIAGRYSSTYNAVDTGITDKGYELSVETKGELINSSDAYGDSIIDFVVRGGNVFCMAESKTYKAGSLTPFYPFGSMGVMSTAAAPLGRLASAIAAAFVLTATSNTPAASTPATLTGTYSILPPDSNLKLLFDSRLRHVPIRLLFLPYISTNVLWFTTT